MLDRHTNQSRCFHRIFILWIAISFIMPLSGCIFFQKDATPFVDIPTWSILNAKVRYEPRSRYGNKSPYQVGSKTFYVAPSSKGYEEIGLASWYGRSFHGHLTANLERYNMYAMTAASRTLPIPTYLKITNLENGRQVIVRVNDRGPFNTSRILDLSYAAAKKLGFSKKGLALVKATAIDTSRR